ncbi:HDOD domain-containing protein [Beggiatoa alba]|nr:HDOD domain-containing protein [Beggiatoa alba]
MIEIKKLITFIDFKDLDDIALVDISENAIINNYQLNERIISEKTSNVILYLLKGMLDLQTTGGVQQSIRANSKRAQYPVFTSHSPGHYARCADTTMIIQIEKSIIDKYGIHNNRENDKLDYADFETLPSCSAKLGLINEITQLFKSHAVTLPSLPDIAQYIHSALDSHKPGSKKLAQIIQIDPIIAARIIQVANSAYGHAATNSPEKVDTVQKACTRIGLDSIRTIVMGVILRDLFIPKNQLVRHKMIQFYEHSIRIAVICYELAKRLPDFNPDRAFLFGLMHDIGAIPVLVVADRHSHLAHKTGNLDAVLKQLKSYIGGMILQQWQFNDHLIENAKQAYNWDREVVSADYCDLVQVALRHSHLVGGEIIDGPELFELRAFKRLGLDQRHPVDDIKLLKEISLRVTKLIKNICKAE